MISSFCTNFLVLLLPSNAIQFFTISSSTVSEPFSCNLPMVQPTLISLELKASVFPFTKNKSILATEKKAKVVPFNPACFSSNYIYDDRHFFDTKVEKVYRLPEGMRLISVIQGPLLLT